MKTKEQPTISVRVPVLANLEVQRIFERLHHSRNSQQLAQSISRCFLEYYNLDLACLCIQESRIESTSSPAVICTESRDSGDLKAFFDLTSSDFHKTAMRQVNLSLEESPLVWISHSTLSLAKQNYRQCIILKLGSDFTLRLSSGFLFQGYFALSGENIEQTFAQISGISNELSQHISQLLIDALQNELTYGLWLSFLHDVKHFVHRAELITFRLESADQAETRKLFGLATQGNMELLHRAELMSLLSKHQARGLELSFENCDLWNLLTATITTHRESADKKGVSLRLSPQTKPDEEQRIKADPALFPMILHNIIGNAVRHTPRGGRVELTLERTGDHFKISVLNEGEAIPPDEERRIQTLLQSPGYLPIGRMRGVGLIASKLIANLHGGRLALEKHRDYTTCFALYFSHAL